jgi:hypothetical protein
MYTSVRLLGFGVFFDAWLAGGASKCATELGVENDSKSRRFFQVARNPLS